MNKFLRSSHVSRYSCEFYLPDIFGPDAWGIIVFYRPFSASLYFDRFLNLFSVSINIFLRASSSHASVPHFAFFLSILVCWFFFCARFSSGRLVTFFFFFFFLQVLNKLFTLIFNCYVPLYNFSLCARVPLEDTAAHTETRPATQPRTPRVKSSHMSSQVPTRQLRKRQESRNQERVPLPVRYFTDRLPA